MEEWTWDANFIGKNVQVPPASRMANFLKIGRIATLETRILSGN